MKFKFTLALVPLLLLLGCKPAAEKETSEEITPELVAADCGTEFFYGGRTICLPAFEGYEEMYSDSLVTARFRPLNTGNLILGLYLHPSMYDTLKVNPSAIFDDYYKVYAFSKKSEYFANDVAITEAEITWAEELKKVGKVDLENLDNALPAQGAIIIDQYRNDDYMATSIQLTRLPYEGGEKIAIVTMNTLALRTKLVFFSYYMFYDGPPSVALAKKRNDAFGKAMQEANY